MSKSNFTEGCYVYYNGPHLIKAVYICEGLKYTHRSDPKYDRYKIRSLIKDGLFHSLFDVDVQDIRLATKAEILLYAKK